MSTAALTLVALLAGPLRPAPDTVVDPVACGPEGRNSYALYAPPGYDPARAWPILYVFDPRSRGRLGVDLFRAAAARHGYLIASSNDTRSDSDARPSLLAVQAMWTDTHQRLPLAPGRALAAGFSGGARLATLLGAAAGGELFGVFLAGAGFAEPEAIAKETPFVVYAAAGRLDFNYYELRGLERRLRELGLAHAAEYFDGTHAWPPADVIDRGFDWLELQAMRQGRRARDEPWLQAWEQAALGRAAQLEAEGRPLEAAEAYRQAAEALAGLRESVAGAAAARLEARADVRRERQRRLDLDRREQAWIEERYGLLDHLLPDAPAGPPSAPELLRELEVERARRAAGTELDPYTRDAWKRRVESLYVQAAYYLPRRLRERGEPARAAVSLQVAVALKPESSVARYDLACALARAGRRKQALAALREALDAGFQDGAFMAKDDDLESLRELPEFRALLARLAPAQQ